MWLLRHRRPSEAESELTAGYRATRLFGYAWILLLSGQNTWNMFINHKASTIFLRLDTVALSSVWTFNAMCGVVELHLVLWQGIVGIPAVLVK